MLEAVHTDLVFTISLKRSTQNLQLSTSWAGRLPHLMALSVIRGAASLWSLLADSGHRKPRHHLMGLLRDFVARHLLDGRRLGLDGHLAVSLRNIARAEALNGVQDAVLNACLNANGLEAMPPPMARRDVLVGNHSA